MQPFDNWEHWMLHVDEPFRALTWPDDGFGNCLDQPTNGHAARCFIFEHWHELIEKPQPRTRRKAPDNHAKRWSL